MTIEKNYTNIGAWRNRELYYKLKLPQRCPHCHAVLTKKTESENLLPHITFGTVKSTFEISKNGHKRERRDLVVGVELDSGVKFNILYNGTENNIQAECRVEIENGKIKRVIEKAAGLLGDIKERITESASSAEKAPEASRSSR